MNAEAYRRHPNAALRRAFLRGRLAAEAGVPLDHNPYRKVGVTVKARRSSWTESYVKAWVTGWWEFTNGSGQVPGKTGVRLARRAAAIQVGGAS